MGNHLPPAIFLFFLSPFIAELLSGSAPPVRFFSPAWFFSIVILYGSGAILVRELVKRWNKGLPSLLFLGMAYGIIEEGLALKTFFDPNWPLIGILGSYGRALGINWVWAIELTVGHAIISIAIPIVLTELLFPDERSNTWVDDQTLNLLAFVFAGEVAISSAFFATYPVPLVPYVATGLVAAVLALIGSELPHPLFAAKKTEEKAEVPGPPALWLFGFFSAMALVVIHFSLPHTGIPPVLTILIFISFIAAESFLLLKMSGDGRAWSDMHKFAVISGALSVLVVYAPVQEIMLKKALPVDTAGMSFVGVVFAVFLLWAWGRIRGFEKSPAASA